MMDGNEWICSLLTQHFSHNLMCYLTPQLFILFMIWALSPRHAGHTGLRTTGRVMATIIQTNRRSRAVQSCNTMRSCSYLRAQCILPLTLKDQHWAQGRKTRWRQQRRACWKWYLLYHNKNGWFIFTSPWIVDSKNSSSNFCSSHHEEAS